MEPVGVGDHLDGLHQSAHAEADVFEGVGGLLPVLVVDHLALRLLGLDGDDVVEQLGLDLLDGGSVLAHRPLSGLDEATDEVTAIVGAVDGGRQILVRHAEFDEEVTEVDGHIVGDLGVTLADLVDQSVREVADSAVTDAGLAAAIATGEQFLVGTVDSFRVLDQPRLTHGPRRVLATGLVEGLGIDLVDGLPHVGGRTTTETQNGRDVGLADDIIVALGSLAQGIQTDGVIAHSDSFQGVLLCGWLLDYDEVSITHSLGLVNLFFQLF